MAFLFEKKFNLLLNPYLWNKLSPMPIQFTFESISAENGLIEGRVHVHIDSACQLEELSFRCIQEREHVKGAYWGGQKIALDYATTAQNGWLIPFSFILKQPEKEGGQGSFHLPQQEQDNREAWNNELAKAAGGFHIHAILKTDQEEVAADAPVPAVID